MATILSSPLQRPRSSSSQWLGDEEDEPAAPQPALSTVKESYTVQKVGGTKRIEKPEVKKQEVSRSEVKSSHSKNVEAQKAEVKKSDVKKQATKVVKAKPKEIDTFDVPSSDDEARTEFTLTHISPRLPSRNDRS
ncbi:hypothetical protein LTR17_027295 [Elasticomyces elasticus]|nr:hypothetical protein LTR17_027295 [Elasticomyces elasticus]